MQKIKNWTREDKRLVRLQAPEHQEGEQEHNEDNREKQAVKQPKGPTGAVLQFFEDMADSEDEGEILGRFKT